MEEREERFLEALWAKQEEMKLSNSQFADVLGVDRTLVYHTKSGRRRLRQTLLVAACDRFPELRESYFAYAVTSGNQSDATKHSERAIA